MAYNLHLGTMKNDVQVSAHAQGALRTTISATLLPAQQWHCSWLHAHEKGSAYGLLRARCSHSTDARCEYQVLLA